MPPQSDPATQTTLADCIGYYTVAVPLDPNRITTLSIRYGDGLVDTSAIPAGSGATSFALQHTFVCSDVNPTGADIWYDVNTIPVGYTNHTTQGGDPSYMCATWRFNTGARNVGSVLVNTQGLIAAATNGSQGSGTSVSVASNIAGPFSIAPDENAFNTSPKESGVCLSDNASVNGNIAPLTLI